MSTAPENTGDNVTTASYSKTMQYHHHLRRQPKRRINDASTTHQLPIVMALQQTDRL